MKITICVHLVLSKIRHLEIWPQRVDFTTSLLVKALRHNGGIVLARVLLAEPGLLCIFSLAGEQSSSLLPTVSCSLWFCDVPCGSTALLAAFP